MPTAASIATPASPPARTKMKCRGASIAAASSPSTTASPANARCRWPACTAPMRRAPRSARSSCIYHDRRRHRAAFEGSVHRLRLLLLCLSVRRAAISARSAISDRAARWTNAPIVRAAAAGAPGSAAEYDKYGSNRFGEGKLPICAEMCSTKSLLAGDGDDHRPDLQGAGYQTRLRLRRMGLDDRLS